MGIVGAFEEADLFEFEGDIEAEVVAAREEPVADGVVDPGADFADDLRDAAGSDAQGAGNGLLLLLAEDDEAVDVEVAGWRSSWQCGHGESLG